MSPLKRECGESVCFGASKSSLILGSQNRVLGSQNRGSQNRVLGSQNRGGQLRQRAGRQPHVNQSRGRRMCGRCPGGTRRTPRCGRSAWSAGASTLAASAALRGALLRVPTLLRGLSARPDVERELNLKLSGNEVYCTDALLLPVKDMLCSKL